MEPFISGPYPGRVQICRTTLRDFTTRRASYSFAVFCHLSENAALCAGTADRNGCPNSICAGDKPPFRGVFPVFEKTTLEILVVKFSSHGCCRDEFLHNFHGCFRKAVRLWVIWG